MTKPLFVSLQETFDSSGLGSVFREILGWNSIPDETETFVVQGHSYTGNKIASMLNSVGILEFDFQNQVDANTQRQLISATGLKYAEKLLIIHDEHQSTWLWPKRAPNGTITYEKFLVKRKTLPTFLAQRLVALRFTSSELMDTVTISTVRQKLQGTFDTNNVTKKFYRDFKDQHAALAMAISGTPEDAKNSYATVILNRLMFIYFLQKKEFLNEDSDYLRNCLSSIRKLNGEGHFYSFYKDLLLVLFFEGLNSRTRNYPNAKISKVIGDVPYINGGIFGQNEIESTYNITIPDTAFEAIFDFFDRFTWHLDTRPTGNPDEINPEVIGYIFEQYINATADGKRENGAYYTKQDVTSFMTSQTIAPHILSKLVNLGFDFWPLLVNDPLRYIPQDLLHGWDFEAGAWIEAPLPLEEFWASEPEHWTALDDASSDPAILLPDEKWVEGFTRRQRTLALVTDLRNGALTDLDELIDKNINTQLLCLDIFASLDTDRDIEQAWLCVSETSVLDPTCGSGAFLFAALEIFETFYSQILDASESLGKKGIFSEKLSTELSKHANRRYFIRKHSAVQNLFGTDLMPDAIETAKLRVFLALASCLDDVRQIEPLPDLDFNLKAGNLLIGFKDADDVERVASGDIFAAVQIRDLEPKIATYVSAFENFMQNTSSAGGASFAQKQEIRNLSQAIAAEANEVLLRVLDIDLTKTEEWLDANRPFHWFLEFPKIINDGGFEIIVGNPPYVQINADTRLNNKANGINGYKTDSARDLYAICYERSLQLLAVDGRHTFIVPINLAFSDNFKILREHIKERFGRQWWSTYDQLPQGLFEGAAVRNTILFLASGEAQRVRSTHHRVFGVESRQWLFTNLEYFTAPVTQSLCPARSGISNDFVASILEMGGSLGRQATGKLCLKATANYWVPVSPKRPPVLDLDYRRTKIIDKKIREMSVGSLEDELLLMSWLAGKIGFIWWQSFGDGMDVIETTFTQFRIAIAGIESEKLTRAAEDLLLAGKNNTVVNMYLNKNYASIRWAGVREVSDVFDRQMLKELSLEQHWRNLNILYRQIYRSNESRQSGQDTQRNAKIWD